MSKKISGFTLIELVVTIAVVAIMSSLCISIVFSTSALRAEKEDRMALGEMNNIFVSEWGAESYAYPQTAADIKHILIEHGYNFSQPRTGGAEWWFDTSNGRMCIGVVKGGKLSLDYGNRVVDLVSNNQIITPDGFLPGFVYMGEQYRGIIDAFLSVNVDDGVAAEELNTVLNDNSYPIFIRDSLATLAANALFVGSKNVLSFVQSEEAALNDDAIYNFQATPYRDSTVAVFTVKSLSLNDQLQNCYIKSLYIPSDVEINEINDRALDGSWIQRILINKDMPTLTDNNIYNYDYDALSSEIVPVLRKYYPSELPIYQLDERRIDKFLKLYSAGWHKDGLENFEVYYSNELIHKSEIETLNREFYKLRPYERKYVLSCREVYKKFDLNYDEQILETIKALCHNKDVLEELYKKLTATRFEQEKLLQSKFLPSGDLYSLQDALSGIVSESDAKANAWNNFDKLFVKDEIFADGAVKLDSMSVCKFTAQNKGEGSITLLGVLQDENNDNHEIKFPFLVQGAYDSVAINSVILEAGREITRSDINATKRTIKSEYYGTFDANGKPYDMTLNVMATGDYIYDNETWEIKKVEVKANGSTISLASNQKTFNVNYTQNDDITVTVTIGSYLDESVTAVIENIPFKGNTANVFSALNIDTINGTMGKKRNLALHSDVTITSQSTLLIPEDCFVYGNGHTFTNKTKSAEDSAWASSHGEFRFPAVVTVYGTIENLKIVAQIPNLTYRFSSVAYAEDGETTTYTNLGLTYIKGAIKNNYWTQNNKNNSVYLLASRLAAVRVYGSGSLDTCVVEGGQYGIHLIGGQSTGNRFNLNNVWVKNSLAANIYVSDNDGAMQNISLNNVHTYNALNMEPAFPILVEPKVNAVPANRYGYRNVKGYGIVLKYFYDLLDGKLFLDVNDLYAHNTITYSEYYDLLLQYVIQNMEAVDNEFLKYFWVESQDYFEIDLKLIILHLANVNTGASITKTLVNGDFRKLANNNINMPIIYGEQSFLEIYDQVLCISDKGQNEPPSSLIGSLHKIDKRNTFETMFKNQEPARGACGVNARGTNEVALSFYNVATISGGAWTEPNLAIR